MNRTALLLAAAVLAACATQDQADKKSTQDTAQAIRDFIEVRDLQEADKLRTSSRDAWTALDQNFVLYKSRHGAHLIEFVRRCHELDDATRIVADERHSTSHIYSRFETLRGCRIARMYPLTEHEQVELEHIGDAVGSHN